MQTGVELQLEDLLVLVEVFVEEESQIHYLAVAGPIQY
jgi:hypothetical protein